LASTKGHEWLVTCVPVQDVLSQGMLSMYDLWHFSVQKEIGGNFNPAKAG